MMRTPEKFGKDAVKWLDTHFVVNKYALSYSDGNRQVEKLLNIAAQARSELALYLPKISEKRSDVKYNLDLYKTAVQRIISIVENAHSQLLELRPQFAKTHSSPELALYDKRINFMETRLRELKQDVKWTPRELRGYKPKEVEIAAETYVASLKPFKADMVFTIAELERGERKERLAALPKKVPQRVAAAQTMAFTEAEALEYRKGHMPIPAPKQTKGKGEAAEMVFTLEEFELQNKIKGLTAQIKKAKEEHNPMKVRALRIERKEAWLKYSEISGEKPPKHVLRA